MIFNLFEKLKKSLEFNLENNLALNPNYRISLKLYSLNQKLQSYVSSQQTSLLVLNIDSDNDSLILSGEYDTSKLYLTKFFKVEKIKFRAILKLVSIRRNRVRLKIHNYQVKTVPSKKIDIIQIISKFDRFHRMKVLKSIETEFPEFIKLTRLKNEIIFDLNYFLNDIPELVRNLLIQEINLSKGRIVFLAKSNTLIKSLLEYFGPEYIQIDSFV